MKQIITGSILITMLCIAGCTTAPNDHKAMLEANRALMNAIETGDTAVISKYVAQDATDHGGAPDGGDLKGPELIQMLGSIHNDIDNLKMDVVQDAANDSHVFTLVHMTGTTNKALWGMPANHKIDSKSVDLIQMKDGKIVDHWGFFNMEEMMAMMQLGAPGTMGTDSSKMRMMDSTMAH